MKIDRHRQWIVALILLLLSCGCATFRPAPPEVSLLDLKVGEFTLSHANLLADVRIYNPNPVPLTVKEVEYRFFLDDIKLATGRSFQPVKIESDGTGTISLRVSTGYLSLLDLTTHRKTTDNLSYRLEGLLKVGGLRVLDSTFPFVHEGELSLDQIPLR